MITTILMTGGSKEPHTPYQGNQQPGQTQLSFTHSLFLCPVINIISISIPIPGTEGAPFGDFLSASDLQ